VESSFLMSYLVFFFFNILITYSLNCILKMAGTLFVGGAAEADGKLMKGDRILEVCGKDLKDASQEE